MFIVKLTGEFVVQLLYVLNYTFLKNKRSILEVNQINKIEKDSGVLISCRVGVKERKLKTYGSLRLAFDRMSCASARCCRPSVWRHGCGYSRASRPPSGSTSGA
jgi:hypothetical protein